MFNLLPKEQRKEIYAEYRFRLFTLIFIFLSLTGIIAMVLLVPILITSNLEYNNLLKSLEILQKETPELENSQDIQLAVKKTNNILTVLRSGKEQTPLLIWSKVIDNKPPGVKIDSFVFNKNNEEVKITIGGNALTRESLINFAKSLESQDPFEDINLPVSDLARERNLDFSITFGVKS